MQVGIAPGRAGCQCQTKIAHIGGVIRRGFRGLPSFVAIGHEAAGGGSVATAASRLMQDGRRHRLVPASLRKKAGDQVKTHAVLADSNHPAAKVNAGIEAMSYDELDGEPSGRNRHCVPDGTRGELPNQVSNGHTPRRSRRASREIKKTATRRQVIDS